MTVSVLEPKHTEGLLLQGPPPGFGPPAPTSNGNALPGFPSQSGSDSSVTSVHDQQAQAWAQNQAAPQQWAAFHQSHSSPDAASHTPSSHGLQHSQSAGPAGYQSNTFGMPGLSSLQNLREHPGSEHTLFSGSSDLSNFSQSQFRQRSRFQFAQDPPLGDANLADDPSSPSVFSSLMGQPAQHGGPSQYDHSRVQSQHHNQRHPSDHQLFSAGSGLTPASLFAGGSGLANASVPHQLGMHSAAGIQGDAFAHAAASLMGQPGQHQHIVTKCIQHLCTGVAMQAAVITPIPCMQPSQTL